MSTPEYVYHPEMPDHCPPQEAEPVDQLYRAVEVVPPCEKDFLSDVETGKCNRKKPRCDDWGCSVWRDIDAVDHGRKIYSHFRELFVVEGHLASTDGQIMYSPSKRQPKHCTFWKSRDRNVAGKFKTLMEPEPIGPDDPFSAE